MAASFSDAFHSENAWALRPSYLRCSLEVHGHADAIRLNGRALAAGLLAGAQHAIGSFTSSMQRCGLANTEPHSTHEICDIRRIESDVFGAKPPMDPRNLWLNRHSKI